MRIAEDPRWSDLCFGVAFEWFLGLFLLSDILHVSDEIQRISLRVAHDAPAHENPHDLSVLA